MATVLLLMASIIASFFTIQTACAPSTNSSAENNDTNENENLTEVSSFLTDFRPLQQNNDNSVLMKAIWQDWSNWSKCKSGERIRTRLCILPDIRNDTNNNAIDFTDLINGTTDNKSLSMICKMRKIETEKQFCFTSKIKEDKSNQKLNPFTIEEEIAASYLRRAKVNHEPVKVIKIHPK